MMNTIEQSANYIINTLELEDTLENRRQFNQELEETAGVTTTGQIVYREHYIIGLKLWLNLDNNLISGEGAKFDQAFETTRRHLAWQQLKDRNLMLTIPEQFKTDILLAQITPTQAIAQSKIIIGFLGF